MASQLKIALRSGDKFLIWEGFNQDNINELSLEELGLHDTHSLLKYTDSTVSFNGLSCYCTKAIRITYEGMTDECLVAYVANTLSFAPGALPYCIMSTENIRANALMTLSKEDRLLVLGESSLKCIRNEGLVFSRLLFAVLNKNNIVAMDTFDFMIGHVKHITLECFCDFEYVGACKEIVQLLSTALSDTTPRIFKHITSILMDPLNEIDGIDFSPSFLEQDSFLAAMHICGTDTIMHWGDDTLQFYIDLAIDISRKKYKYKELWRILSYTPHRYMCGNDVWYGLHCFKNCVYIDEDTFTEYEFTTSMLENISKEIKRIVAREIVENRNVYPIMRTLFRLRHEFVDELVDLYGNNIPLCIEDMLLEQMSSL